MHTFCECRHVIPVCVLKPVSINDVTKVGNKMIYINIYYRLSHSE